MIAEGLEKPDQAAYRRQHGVQSTQSWLFSRPMDFRAMMVGGLVGSTAREPREAGFAGSLIDPSFRPEM